MAGWNLCIEQVDRSMGTQGLILMQLIARQHFQRRPTRQVLCLQELLPTPSYSHTLRCAPLLTHHRIRNSVMYVMHRRPQLSVRGDDWALPQD